MKQRIHSAARLMVIATSLALPFPIYAAGNGDHSHATGEAHSQRSPDAPRQMSDLMSNMAGQMKDLSKMMMQGNTDPTVHNQMAERMQVLSTMMDHLSGMMDKGMGSMTKDAEMQKMMEQMSKKMDDMMMQPMTPNGKQ